MNGTSFKDALPPPGGASEATCTAGKGGVPKGWIPQLLCHPDGQVSRLGHGLLHMLGHIGAAWSVLLPIAALLVAAVVAAQRVAARRRVSEASQGRWVEFSCPPEVNPDGAAVLWRLLSRRLLTARFSVRRRVIAWELHGSPKGIRAGLWVPPDVSAAAVAAAVTEAWPGAQVRADSSGNFPELPQPPLAAVRLRSAAPSWLPVTAVDRSAGYRTHTQEADLLRAVFGSLAACRTAGACVTVQVLVRRASKHHSRKARAAVRYLRGLPPGRGIVPGSALMFLDIVTGG